MNKDLYDIYKENQGYKNVTVSRGEFFSYDNTTYSPILFGHYLHEHMGTYKYTYTQENTNWCTIFITVNVGFAFMLGSTLYTPKCGDVILIKSDRSAYQMDFYDSMILNYYEINIPCEFFDKAPQLQPIYDMFYKYNKADVSMISIPHSEQTKMFNLLCEIENLLTDEHKYYDCLSLSYLLQIGDIICNHMSAGTPFVRHRKISALENSIKYISENYLNINSISEIADACHISVSYLCRIFKNHLNISPIDYVNVQKLSYAKYLLKNGRNVTETCYECGFNNYNHFITSFKNHIGKTPREFARSAE